jgi:hypothetical protein
VPIFVLESPQMQLWAARATSLIQLLTCARACISILVGRCILHLHMHESWEDEASRPIFPLYIQINQIKSKYSTCHRGLTYLPKQLNWLFSLELKRTLGTRSRYIELCTVLLHSTSMLFVMHACMHACMHVYVPCPCAPRAGQNRRRGIASQNLGRLWARRRPVDLARFYLSHDDRRHRATCSGVISIRK